MSSIDTYRAPSQPDIDLAWGITIPAIRAVMLATGTSPGVTGRETLPNEYTGRVDSMTHHNSYDALFHGVSEWRHSKRSVRHIARKSLFETFGTSYVLWRLGAIPIDRGSDKYHSEVSDLVDLTAELAKQGDIIGVFDEGQRINGFEVGELLGIARLVAKKAGVLVVPVGIAGRQDFRSWVPRSGHVHYGEPMETRNVNSKTFNAELRKRKQQALNVAMEYYRSVHGRYPASGPLLTDKLK